MIFYFFFGGLIISAVLTYLGYIYSMRFNVLAHPCDRSAHVVPTPRGGGISIVITLLSMLVYAGVTGLMNWEQIFSIALPGGLVAGIGFIDDHQPMRVSHRLLIHFAASSIAILLLPSLPSIDFGVLTISSPIVIYPIMLVGLVWLLNLYNFMDGIDAIAGSEAICVCLSAAIILYFTDEMYWSSILIWICSPILGFLIWNWPPAKIFMGDVGSGFLGIIIGVIALLTTASTALTLWSWLILLAVFIADATWTLLVRMATGNNWHQPHASHAYQILARKKKSHAFVSLCIVAINVGWLAPLAWFSVIYPYYGWVITFLAYLPILSLCWSSGAGLASRKDINTEIKKDFQT